MDTDELSNEAYDVVIRKAEMFHHDLTLQFGVLASDCKDEDEYLKEALLIIKDWESDYELAVDKIFYENVPEINIFKAVLRELKKAIIKIQKLPMDKRTFEEW